MDKYTLLLILNLPFVVFGFIKAAVSYKQEIVGRMGLIIRFGFWFAILMGLVFAQSIYTYLAENKLTDSGPLSLPDVILVTGVIFSLFLIIRLYSKVELLEKKLTDLHEKLSITLSETKK
jgi:hypothetical protein